MTKTSGPRPVFPLKKAIRNSANKGVTTGILAGGTKAAAFLPVVGVFLGPAALVAIPVAAAVGFVGAAVVGFGGEIMNYMTDEPLPVFDSRTTLLFDTVGMIVCFMLFVIPALRLDLALSSSTSLPGAFGYMTLFLSAFLITILRGLLCNLGIARESDDRTRT